MIAVHKRLVQGVALAMVVTVAAGCSQSTGTALPDPATMPARAGAAADRARHQQSMNDLKARGGSHAQEAVKEIEASR